MTVLTIKRGEQERSLRLGDSAWDESKHPRDGGKFSSGQAHRAAAQTHLSAAAHHKQLAELSKHEDRDAHIVHKEAAGAHRKAAATHKRAAASHEAGKSDEGNAHGAEAVRQSDHANMISRDLRGEPDDEGTKTGDASWEEGKHPRSHGMFASAHRQAAAEHNDLAEHHSTQHEKANTEGRGAHGKLHLAASNEHFSAMVKHKSAARAYDEGKSVQGSKIGAEAHERSHQANEHTIKASHAEGVTTGKGAAEQISARVAAQHRDGEHYHSRQEQQHIEEGAAARLAGQESGHHEKAAEAHRVAGNRHGMAAHAHETGSKTANEHTTEAAAESGKAETASQAAAKKDRDGDANLKEAGTMGLHVIKNPAGTHSFVGHIPPELGEEVPASTSDIMGGRAHKNEKGDLVTHKFPAFKTVEEAHAHAAKHGYKSHDPVKPK